MQIVRATNDRVIEADNERRNLALWLAHCELGPEPKFNVDETGHRAYSRRLHETARRIFDRLN